MSFEHYVSFLPFAGGYAGLLLPLVVIVVLWEITLKGFALWYAARGGQKWWFVAFLVIHTVGILEIVYLLFFRPKHEAPATSSSAPAVQ